MNLLALMTDNYGRVHCGVHDYWYYPGDGQSGTYYYDHYDVISSDKGSSPDSDFTLSKIDASIKMKNDRKSCYLWTIQI